MEGHTEFPGLYNANFMGLNEKELVNPKGIGQPSALAQRGSRDPSIKEDTNLDEGKSQGRSLYSHYICSCHIRFIIFEVLLYVMSFVLPNSPEKRQGR